MMDRRKTLLHTRNKIFVDWNGILPSRTILMPGCPELRCQKEVKVGSQAFLHHLRNNKNLFFVAVWINFLSPYFCCQIKFLRYAGCQRFNISTFLQVLSSSSWRAIKKKSMNAPRFIVIVGNKDPIIKYTGSWFLDQGSENDVGKNGTCLVPDG
jgi:hypothetical protein